jgi:lipopolysaccharide biosynthesis protein
MSEFSLNAGTQTQVIAFYLPQYYPTRENDEWWGPGFTEWTNVVRGRPLFPGHAQPHLPADLGFYDLRLAETRDEQARLASEHGVAAFCYWHYWFACRRMLERPFADVLARGEPRLPFCHAWANQTWSGRWHGAADRVLIEQTYPGPEDDKRHFEHLLPAFEDERYFRVDGKPLFYVFRPEDLPDAAAFVERWQGMAADAGLGGVYLVAELSDLSGAGVKYPRHRVDGFNARVYIRIPARVDPVSVLRMRFGRKIMRWPERYPYADFHYAPPATLAG